MSNQKSQESMFAGVSGYVFSMQNAAVTTGKKLEIAHLGAVQNAQLWFDDLTVIIAQNRLESNLLLQLYKLYADLFPVSHQLYDYGILEYNAGDFCNVYFGDNYSTFVSKKASINGNTIEALSRIDIDYKADDSKHSVLYIPSQREQAVRYGIPRPFSDYKPVEPFVLRSFSHELHRALPAEACLFPKSDTIPIGIQERIKSHIFNDFDVSIRRLGYIRQLVLENGGSVLPYICWPVGQKYFTTMLLAVLYVLNAPNQEYREIIIEEPELGLHPKGIEALMLLLFHLMDRGYKVIITSNSYSLIEMLWVFQTIKSLDGNGGHLAEVFGSTEINWDNIIKKTIRVYSIASDNNQLKISDISSLELDDEKSRNWGGILDFGERNSKVIADLANEKGS